MVGVWMGLLALLVIPLGFLLAWWMVRQLERGAVAKGGRSQAPTPLSETPIAQTPGRLPHPSSQAPVNPGSHALDDAPAEVIAALAQQLAARDTSGRHPGDTP